MKPAKLFVLVTVLYAKLMEGRLRINPETTGYEKLQYATHFSCNVGTCDYRIRARIENPRLSLNSNSAGYVPASLKLAARVVLDTDTDASRNGVTCDLLKKSRGRTTIEVPNDGSYGPWSHNQFRQHSRPRLWYFFVDDCYGIFRSTVNMLQHQQIPLASGSKPDNQPISVHYQLEIRQTDGTQITFEYSGLFRYYVFQLVSFAALLVYSLKLQAAYARQNASQLHLMTHILNLSMVAHICVITLSMFGISSLKRGADAERFIRLLTNIIGSTDLMAIGSCLTLISMGYTLNVNFRPTKLKPYVITALLIASSTILLIVEYRTWDSRYFYVPGAYSVSKSQLLCSVLYGSMFIFNVVSLLTQASLPTQTRSFVNKLMGPAISYFISKPILLLVCGRIGMQHREHVFSNVVFFIHMFALCSLNLAFLGKGNYYNASIMSTMLLPSRIMPKTKAV